MQGIELKMASREVGTKLKEDSKNLQEDTNE